ncbi:hypothetical protein EAI_13608 [Harpegnathos saltator]|uniref:Uncharacterized protein n=1 Tax=Harpegnathos saltator TaxID=610380 RepID=E2BDT0_HARSA|nr:hypothetical protein EAI_13608 [Harpegnathos saltator]
MEEGSEARGWGDEGEEPRRGAVERQPRFNGACSRMPVAVAEDAVLMDAVSEDLVQAEQDRLGDYMPLMTAQSTLRHYRTYMKSVHGNYSSIFAKTTCMLLGRSCVRQTAEILKILLPSLEPPPAAACISYHAPRRVVERNDLWDNCELSNVFSDVAAI